MKALVTGAGGMIGTSLCRRLIGRGDEVRGLFMPDEPDRGGLAAMGVEIVRGNICHPDTIAGMAEGCDIAFHLAGRVEEWGRRSLFRESHLVGTTNVVRECVGKVDRFVYFSSIAYYGPAPAAGKTEDAEPVLPGLPYPDMKAACERVVRCYSVERGLKYTIIRPDNVIGPRSAHVRNVVDSFLKGPVPLVEGGSPNVSFVYLENLVDGVLLAADSQKAVNRAYHFVDDFEVTWGEYMTMVGALVGKKPLLSLSYKQAYALAWLAEYLFLPFGKRPPFTRFAVSIIGQDNHVDTTRAREELGWKTRVQWPEVWAELEEWVKKEFRA
jgi:nucleoside-diphosphate-sugar epimerase